MVFISDLLARGLSELEELLYNGKKARLLIRGGDGGALDNGLVQALTEQAAMRCRQASPLKSLLFKGVAYKDNM